MSRITLLLAAGSVVLATSLAIAAQTITRADNLSVAVAADGRVAMDLLGDIWIVPAGGGRAEALTEGLLSARRPRWSPDTSKIAYQSTVGGDHGIWLYEFGTEQLRKISRGRFFDMQPAWHPGGERIVYASDATGAGFDLWEVDLQSDLHWRISDRPGDETEPAWSSNGRDLVYVHHHLGQWSLVLRRQGLPEETLVSGTDRLAAPAWRPDGSLITYLRQSADATGIDMVILSQPRLVRSYATGEDFALAPLNWLDRHRLVYTAGGEIRQRLFNAWTSSPLSFRATPRAMQPLDAGSNERRQLQRIEEPAGRLVVHASRLHDGLGGAYQADIDIIIDGGLITALEPHRERADTIVIDMGDLTVLPGYIDTLADLTAGFDKFGDNIGPLLLLSGVTTVVADHADGKRLNRLWSGKATPGPRLLPATDWRVPRVTGLADATTPGLAGLLQSRQARLLAMPATIRRRFAEPPGFAAVASGAVLGSRDNELAPGIALHAEFLALAAAGLSPERILRAAGVNAAAALRVDLQLGRIAVGAAADLLFVDGDPLANVADAIRIVAVVRNGRFYSARGLIDRVETDQTVE
ncbi:MAG: amidohydrolase family protein [Woeseiaceae bacterium]|nr:amidohydrolase family protein [Woeseiaceae bacterium]